MARPLAHVGQRSLEAIAGFFVGGGFCAFALSLLLFYELMLVALLLLPGAETGAGAFADEFRVWCFDYDPATGRLNWGYAMGMIGPPLLVGGIVALFWWGQLRELLRRRTLLAAHVAAAALLVSGAAAGFAVLDASPERGDLPFPADALRTAHPAPAFRLQNQLGESVDLTALRGRVVVLTAVYTSCPHTCPLILAQAKRVFDGLSPAQRSELSLVAVTLDPELDTPDRLAELARRHGLETPLYQLVGGDVAEVERVLDDMGIARTRDAETGVIDHANLFLVLDRGGSVAYRFSLGERQERWLASAVEILLREPSDAG